MNVIGTAGHVDHGKSTLVRRLTGIDPDRFAEEKRRGLTLDLGFAWLPLPSGIEIGLVDVPGHENLVRNMLAGAHGISICLFVVAANEGWSPQSAEHLTILDALRVNAGVVALTKSDLVTSDELRAVEDDVRRRLEPSSLVGAAIVPCSAHTGEGIDALLTALDEVVATTPPAPDHDRPRLWVDRSFSMRGAGTVVTGTLLEGRLARGNEVEVLPDRRRTRVRSIQTHKREVESLSPGNRCALNLVGLERREVARGDVVARPGTWKLTRRVSVELSVPPRELSGLDTMVTERGSHLLYVGSAETGVRLRLLDAEEVRPGGRALAQLILQKALPLTRGDRFVLRDAGPAITVGGGVVLDPHPEIARRHDAAHIALLERMRGSDPDALLALVDHEGSLALEDSRARTGVSEPPAEVTVLGGLLVSRRRLDELRAGLTRALDDFHAREPLAAGMPREELRADLDLPSDAFDALLEREGGVREDGGRVALVSHRAALEVEQSEAGAKLVSEIDAAGFQPPLERELGADAALVRALIGTGALVRVGDFLLSRARAAEARAAVRARIAEAGPVTVADIRDLLGTSRKYAVPLCEWLDATGATTRKGDHREIGPLD